MARREWCHPRYRSSLWPLVDLLQFRRPQAAQVQHCLCAALKLLAFAFGDRPITAAGAGVLNVIADEDGRMDYLVDPLMRAQSAACCLSLA